MSLCYASYHCDQLPERLAQLIHPSLDRRPAVDGGGGLDAGMPHLRLDHVQRHGPGNGPGAKRVAQPVRRRSGQALPLVRWQARGPDRFG